MILMRLHMFKNHEEELPNVHKGSKKTHQEEVALVVYVIPTKLIKSDGLNLDLEKEFHS